MMEYLDGEPLSRRLTRERLGIGKAVDIAIQAARAVSASHAMEIIHRDLKPENLFLVPDPMSPGGERVKVLDFGIAKLRPDWGGSDGPKTRTGVIFGTPAYMSPEQCRGLNDEVDASTDVYALGCILFEMLSGHAPYVSPGWGDVLMMHMSDEIPRPSATNPRVTPAIEKVILTALAKKKSDRFASMRDMHRALAQARNDVQDTPAPLVMTDPALPAVVLGVDGLAIGRGTGSAARGSGAHAPGDTFVAVETFALAQRRRLRSYMLAGGIALGGVALALAVGLWVAYRRPAGALEAAHAAASGPAANPAAASMPAAPRQERPSAAAPAASGEEESPPTAPAAAGSETSPSSAQPRAQSQLGESRAKSKGAKSSHRHPARRKDPVKW
jgi:serine/threonine-protein kinase